MATMTVEKWIEEIKGMSVLDLSNLVKALEEEFGVSAAAAPVAVAAAPGGGGAAVEAAEEEKTDFDVVLTAAGASKIQVIKVVKGGPRAWASRRPRISWTGAPQPIKERRCRRDEADKLKAELEAGRSDRRGQVVRCLRHPVSACRRRPGAKGRNRTMDRPKIRP